MCTSSVSSRFKPLVWRRGLRPRRSQVSNKRGGIHPLVIPNLSYLHVMSSKIQVHPGITCFSDLVGGMKLCLHYDDGI